MAINYSVTSKSNPRDPMAQKKWYASAQVAANYTFEELCKDVEKMSTLTEGDVQAVVSSAIFCIMNALKRSESVKLGDWGTFRIGLSSQGTDAVEDFSVANIKRVRVTFTAGRRLKDSVKSAAFKRVDPRPKAPVVEEPESQG